MRRISMTSNEVRSGFAGVIHQLVQGKEIVLLHHGHPVAVIRPWSDDTDAAIPTERWEKPHD